MFKKISQILAKIIHKGLYKTDVIGIENIPKQGPIILAPHHVHDHLDPILLKSVIPRDLYFISAAEVFLVYPYTKWLFRDMGNLPFYRDPKHFGKRRLPEVQGTIELKKENRKTIRKTVELLAKGKCIVIFPEGEAMSDPTFFRNTEFLKPQLGFVYFPMAVKKQYNIEVPIIPIGFKYSTDYKEAIIKIGKPYYLQSNLAKSTLNKTKTELKLYANLIMNNIKQLSK